MLMFADPIVVQVAPSGDVEPVNFLPLRTTRTQSGAIPLLNVCELVPPVLVRRRNSTPLDALTIIIACLDPAVKLSRIMTPAFAHGLLFPTSITLALISQGPLAV